MNKRVIVLILVGVFIIGLWSFVEAKSTKTTCDMTHAEELINLGLDKINSYTQYLDFIAQSRYKSFRVVIDKGEKEYYFEYNTDENIVERPARANYDFSVKMNCNQMNKLIQAYDEKNVWAFERMTLGHIPILVKINLFRECMNTEWCRNEIIGK